MDSKKKVTISWSGGKDSAYALYKVLQQGRYEVVSIHTVINSESKRVGLHGIHELMIEEQGHTMKIPLIKLYVTPSDDHEEYRQLMRSFYDRCSGEGIEGVVFGDIFLEDLRSFREQLLKASGLQGIFPLWKADSRDIINGFLDAGFRTVLCAANKDYFSPDDTGKTIDREFLVKLGPGVDPCGENGEFHTFVYDGPVFSSAITYRLGETVERKYHYNTTDPDGRNIMRESTFLFREILL